MRSDKLSISALSANYGGRDIVQAVTLHELAPGSVTALIGPNAAGKSTLLKSIAGIVKTSSATITLGGLRLDGMTLAERARHIRFVPQAYATQARLTVFDLLMVARMCNRGGRQQESDLNAVDAALSRVGVSHLADRIAGTLSGGQQQLVALAQALTRPAPVLLLDEPTSALDLRNQLEAMAIMRRVAAEDGAIVIAALHDINLAARHTDRVVLMCEGRIMADGPPESVLTTERCGPVYGVSLATGQTSRGSLAIEAYLA